MKPENLDRIRFITYHFNEFQGLRCLVPLGLITLSSGLSTAFHSIPLFLLQIAVSGGALFLTIRSGSYYRTTFGEVKRQPANLSAQLAPLSIFSPAGAATRIETYRTSLNPSTRPILTAVGLAFILFSVLWAISPAVAIDRPTHGSNLVTQTVSYGGDREFTLESLVSGIYFLYGSFFFGTWLWRSHRLSQGHYLVFGSLLLGLGTLGVTLGFVLSALWDLGIVRIARIFLPALSSMAVAQILCGTSCVLAGLLDHWQLVRAFGLPAGEGQL